MHLHLLAAVDFNGAMGRAGGLPWSAPADLARFRQKTMGQYLLLGRKTYESLPGKLAGRELLVLTRHGNTPLPKGGEIVFDIGHVLVGFERKASEIYVGGGAEVYRHCLPWTSTMEITVVHLEVEGADTYFPDVDLSAWTLTARHDVAADALNPAMSYLTLERQRADLSALEQRSPPGFWRNVLDMPRPSAV